MTLLLMLACLGEPVRPDDTPPLEDGSQASHVSHRGESHHAEPGSHHGDHARMHHRFDDPEKWSAIFDDPERATWQKPEEVVAAMAIEPGMAVADIGAGTGYLNKLLADAVGAKGKVIAIDIEPSLVAHMAERAEREGTPQVEVRLGAAGDPRLDEGEVDRIVLLDVYHHIDQREAYFSALLHAVKPGGRLIIVDFKPGELPVGPPPAGKVAPAQVTAELGAAGWKLAERHDLPYQFVHVYEGA